MQRIIGFKCSTFASFQFEAITSTPVMTSRFDLFNLTFFLFYFETNICISIFSFIDEFKFFWKIIAFLKLVIFSYVLQNSCFLTENIKVIATMFHCTVCCYLELVFILTNPTKRRNETWLCLLSAIVKLRLKSTYSCFFLKSGNRKQFTCFFEYMRLKHNFWICYTKCFTQKSTIYHKQTQVNRIFFFFNPTRFGNWSYLKSCVDCAWFVDVITISWLSARHQSSSSTFIMIVC